MGLIISKLQQDSNPELVVELAWMFALTCLTIALSGVTAKDYAQVAFSRADMASAKYAPECETAEGELYIWSKTDVMVTIPLIVITKG